MIPVLIMGKSGSGKSTSMRNFEENEIGVFNVASKPLPFRKKLKILDHANYEKIAGVLSNPKLKTYVIDDSQYLMAFEEFEKAKQTGYSKYTDIAKNFYDLNRLIIESPHKDVIVYFLHHTEQSVELGTKAKTSGKMLDDKLNVEGLFSIVLMSVYHEKEFKFQTQTTGMDTVKSPIGMFEEMYIDNDLKYVDAKIREYWSLSDQNKDNEV